MSANSSSDAAVIKEKLTPIVAKVGLEIDELKISRAGKYRVLEIAIDGDQVDLDKVAMASRSISEYLDETNLMGEQQYTLEVTTRGVDRPLSRPVHWKRNLGRLVKVSGDSINAIGRIKSFDEPIVVLEINGKDKEIDINSISKAIIEIEFSKQEKSEQE